MKPNLIGSYDLKEYETTNQYLNKINICVNYREGLKNRFAYTGVVGESLPWKKTQANIGIRGGEVTIWGGHNSHGKALAIDTLLPTADGWKKMKDVHPGDKLFDEDGNQCNVIAETEIMVGRPCYRLTFNDGTEIIADEHHEWFTYNARARNSWRQARDNDRLGNRPIAKFGTDQSAKQKKPSIVTTKQIAETLTVTEASYFGLNNHSIPVAGPLKTERVDLPVPPYLLGAWLGDGDSNGGGFTTTDEEILQQLINAGVTVTKRSGKYRYGLTGGFQATLRVNGLIKNKHIPAIYLRASMEDRLELLRGLMDTDGSVTDYGRCEFTSIKQDLAKQVLELVRSLGIQARLITGRARLNGVYISDKFRVTFTPRIRVFHLRRKASRLKEKVSVRTKHRFIVGCERIDSVPVKCIQVDSPSHLYLASEAMIPTHNSLLLGQVVSGLINQGSGVMIASMEMRPTASLYRMCRQATMRPDPDEATIDEYLNWADDRLWFFDYDGSVRPASLLQLIRFSADVLKCKHVVVDSLMKCRISSKDPDAYRDFVDEICVVAKDFDIHVHLVAHSRKGDTDRDLITRMDIKGASEIVDQVDNCFLVWRNKKKEEEIEAGEFRKAEEPDSMIIVDKHRHGEWEGKINLWYDKRSLQYCETIERKPINLMSAPRAAGGTVNVKSNSLEDF